MSEGLTRKRARHIIEVVGSSGTPPEWGFQFFTAGLDPFLQVLEEDYLRTFIQDGGASFKVVVGTYGGGKTHFLYSVRELAWKHDFLVTYCPLSHNASPFYRLDLVYKAIVTNLMRPLKPEELLSGAEKGLGAFLKGVYSDISTSMEADGLKPSERHARLKSLAADAVRSVENPNFGRAVRLALEALEDRDADLFEEMLQYLTVDGYHRARLRKYGLLQAIERAQAFSTIRSLVTLVRNLRFRGLVILFDEAEQAGTMTARQKEMMLANLREMIDQCSSSAFANVMVFYAIPNERFLTEGRSPAYEALSQRIQTVFDFNNPTGVKIRLDKIARDPVALMREIGGRLTAVYEAAYETEIPLEQKVAAVTCISDAVSSRTFGDVGYKRLFVQGLVRGLHALRHEPATVVDAAFAERMITPDMEPVPTGEKNA